MISNLNFPAIFSFGFRIEKIILCAMLCSFTYLCVAQPTIIMLDSTVGNLDSGVVLSKTSFRGLSVVDDDIIWVSGSKGTFAKSIDGGNHFYYNRIKGYEQSDFRDIEAFDANSAIVMSSGTPAVILKTLDGGQTWREAFRKNDSAYFLDAMDFWNTKRGVIVGDPIASHFVLLQTIDGGETWQELDTTQTPQAIIGEAVFAASGTSLRCWGKAKFSFVSKSNLFLFKDFHLTSVIPLTLLINNLSANAGAFSLSKYKNGICIVGGDYTMDTAKLGVSTFVSERGVFQQKSTTCFGYRSCVEYIGENDFIACGTGGIDMYLNNEWKNISSQSFHVVRKGKNGKSVFLAGSKGRIGKLVN